MSNAMEQLYQQVILDHSRQRSGEGALDDFSGQSFQVNPTCGDECTVQVRLADSEHGPILDSFRWSGRGCSISQASLSVLHEMTENKPLSYVDELEELFRELMRGRGQELDDEKQDKLEDAGAFTGVAKYPARIKCALLGWMALKDALAQARA